ncbi:helix-turn-helix domain-containing protein [Streptomyces sp. NPDC051001]|uniref:helix-turn-helix domain-containing protein n=1 Tax=Streptomyces sp. NPDC051001 TaxID=3155795 RepID=UPI00342C86A3
MGRPPSMPVCSAGPVKLTASERHRLKKMAYGHKTRHQARQRATIVLLAARGRTNARIAADPNLHVDTVRRWRGRFAAGRMPALELALSPFSGRGRARTQGIRATPPRSGRRPLHPGHPDWCSTR